MSPIARLLVWVHLAVRTGCLPIHGKNLLKHFPKGVTFGTITSPGRDKLSFGLMLPHLIRGSSSLGRKRFEEILIIQNGDRAGGSAYVAQVAKGIAGTLIPLDFSKLTDSEFVENWFHDERRVQTATLKQFWAHHTKKEEFQDQHTLAMLTFLERCQSTYCAWSDSDVFVHRSASGNGWIDQAVEIMEANTMTYWVTMPRLEETANATGSCKSEQTRKFNSKYFVVHKNRFMQQFPVKVQCAPECGSFEEMIMDHNEWNHWWHEQGGNEENLKEKDYTEGYGMTYACDRQGAWAVRPPENAQVFEEALTECATLNAGQPKKKYGRSAKAGVDLNAGLEQFLKLIGSHGNDKFEFDMDHDRLADSGIGWTCQRLGDGEATEEVEAHKLPFQKPESEPSTQADQVPQAPNADNNMSNPSSEVNNKDL